MSGANIGLHTIAAGLANRAIHLLAFEPEPTAANALRKNAYLNNLDVQVVEAGLSDVAGELDFFESDTYNKGNHTFVSKREHVTRSGVVRVTTMDAACSGVSGPVLLKIDVEGWEALVLRGGLRFLADLDAVAVICEWSPDLWRLNGNSALEIESLLDELGLRERSWIKEADGGLRNLVAVRGYSMPRLPFLKLAG